MKGVFITAISTLGPEIISFYPNKLKLNENEKREIGLKSMPMSGKEGDFISVNLEHFQISCLLTLIPPFEVNYDKRDTFASIGFLIGKDENPIPYRLFLEKLISKCKEHNILNMNTLKEIVPQAYSVFKNGKVNFRIADNISFTIELETTTKKEKTGLDMLDEALW